MKKDEYSLHRNEFGYSIYTDQQIPIITHSGNPIIHSRDKDIGNMEDKQVPDVIKQALYLMLKCSEADEEKKAKALYSVYSDLVEKMDHIESEITNLVYKYSELGDSNEVPEINDFKHWCILTCDPEEVLRYEFVTKSVEEILKEEESGSE